MRSALSQYGSIVTLGCVPTAAAVSRNLPTNSAFSGSGGISHAVAAQWGRNANEPLILPRRVMQCARAGRAGRRAAPAGAAPAHAHADTPVGSCVLLHE
eukprot:COSAG02_NODE_204_length_29210_cov_36.596579_17_plen_99_part_00